MEWVAALLFITVILVLLAGFPVAFTLAGTALGFAFVGEWIGVFDAAFLQALPNRLYGIMTNETLIAVPLFVFMGVMLERAKIAEQLLDAILLQARTAKVREIFLEVRPSNLTALALYRKKGFHKVARRPAYYQATEGREDAAVLAKKLISYDRR